MADAAHRGAERTLSCAHCGLPVAERARKAGPVTQHAGVPEQVWCCVGCRIAAAIGGSRDGRLGFLEARLLVSAFLAMGVMEFTLLLYSEGLAAPDSATLFLRRLGQVSLAFFSLPVLLLLGVPLLRGAWRDLRTGAIRMDGLIVLATFSAFGLSLWHTYLGEGAVYYETATMVLVLVMFGRRLEAHARTKGRDAASALAEVLPKRAHRVLPDGTQEEVDPDRLRAGDTIRILPGDIVPADVRVIRGASTVSAAHITGEELALSAAAGNDVAAGSVNGSGLLEVAVVRPWAEGMLGRIRNLLDAPLPLTRVMRQVDTLASRLAAASIGLAIFGGVRSTMAGGTGEGIRTALSVLLVACPCGLGLATPLAYRALRAALARRGILVSDPAAFEVGPRVDVVFLDKTGTLTSMGNALRCTDGQDAGLYERMATLVAHSGHALGAAMRSSARPPQDLRVVPGSGVEGTIAGAWCRAGSPDWMDREGLDWAPALEDGRRRLTSSGATLVAYAEGRRVRALAAVTQGLRPGAKEAVAALKGMGISCAVLSGDRAEAVEDIAAELAIPSEASLLPDEKLARIEHARHAGHVVLMAADGVNDAPSLRAADVGIAMGSGTAAARFEAQVEIIGDDLRTIPLFLRGSRRLRSIVRGNLAWTLLYNGTALGFATFGRLGPIMAALAMVLSSVAVSVRSHRLLDFGSDEATG